MKTKATFVLLFFHRNVKSDYYLGKLLRSLEVGRAKNLLTLSQLLGCHDNAAGSDCICSVTASRVVVPQLLFDNRRLPSDVGFRQNWGGKKRSCRFFRPNYESDDVTKSVRLAGQMHSFGGVWLKKSQRVFTTLL